ncbi:unnamed protein product [Cuscuta epithymum]|uniref:Uncharacterized protein n=1 Tax=Cuscuta epithymum TaxID=186058 RepID=A0AAV0DZL2_9ASTE|nr:unnamed protein product [Cuscuta epithymum]
MEGGKERLQRRKQEQNDTWRQDSKSVLLLHREASSPAGDPPPPRLVVRGGCDSLYPPIISLSLLALDRKQIKTVGSKKDQTQNPSLGISQRQKLCQNTKDWII